MVIVVLIQEEAVCGETFTESSDGAVLLGVVDILRGNPSAAACRDSGARGRPSATATTSSIGSRHPGLGSHNNISRSSAWIKRAMKGGNRTGWKSGRPCRRPSWQTFYGDRVICCCSSRGRVLPRRGVAREDVDGDGCGGRRGSGRDVSLADRGRGMWALGVGSRAKSPRSGGGGAAGGAAQDRATTTTRRNRRRGIA
uniref:Uncharacterized protein n=1 Tax=Oryza barthii TaxID=65489 RepID=A0A0D3FUX8_9ORYZ